MDALRSFAMDWYLWILAGHVISVIAWMAGMFYLPRLYVYHAEAEVGSRQSETFKTMERRLLRAIINPAMIATWTFGLLLVLQGWPEIMAQGWFHVKLTAIALLQATHAFYARWRRDFAADANRYPARIYRIANEVPTVLMIVIVVMAVVRPF